MDRTAEIYLIKERTEYDEKRRPVIKTESRRRVFSQTRSITRAEWFDAGRNGMQPDICFVISRLDYNGETVIEWHGQKYGVYRTYFGRSDALELYCEQKGGVK